MKWLDLETFIPFVPEDGPAGHTALLSEQLMIAEGPGWAIRVSFPGKYWRETTPRGGDFVIEVTSSSAASGSWEWHKFMHEAIFDDIQAKTNSKNGFMRGIFGPALAAVVCEGAGPDEVLAGHTEELLPGIHTLALLVASQCLALCEHRRFVYKEPVGGRCLPMRFALGIIYGSWNSDAAARFEGDGDAGLRKLRRREIPEPSVQTVLGRSLTSGAACNGSPGTVTERTRFARPLLI